MSQKKAQTANTVSVRNRVALNPIIRKGGVHQKSNKAKRQATKLAIKKREFERGAVDMNIDTAIGSSSFFLTLPKFLPVGRRTPSAGEKSHQLIFAHTLLLDKAAAE